MKFVYLESKYSEFAVDDETFEEISTLVQASKLCTYDFHNRHPYSLENPCVGKNICLEHLLAKQSRLTLLDSPSTNTDGQHFYRFVDRQGMVYTTTEDSSDEATKNLTETMRYYGFTPPLKVESRGKSADFYSYYATVYGNLQTASVLVLAYNHYGEKVKGLFLLYKGGATKELSKKSDLYHRADELVEATKDEHGEYHLNGSSHQNKYEADTLEVISQLESAVYDVTQKLQNGTPTE